MVIGACEDCLTELHDVDILERHPDIAQCPVCGHRSDL